MNNLSALRFSAPVLALGLFGVAAPSHAFFTNAETRAFCLAETIVSLFAVFADHNGECPTLGGSVEIDGVAGTAVVAAKGVLKLGTTLSVHPVRGAFCDVDASGKLGGFQVGPYDGYLPRQAPLTPVTHAWNRRRTIFKSGATVVFGGIDFYDEHNIKDFWRTEENPNSFRDFGLEVITKYGYPRAKWKQRSRYDRPNGQDGKLHVTKFQITPATGCAIGLDLDVDNAGGVFDAFGTVSVSPAPK